MRHSEIVAERLRAHRGCERLSEDSRQQKRARLRAKSAELVDDKYGPRPYRNSHSEIPRKARRDIARIWARKAFKDKTI
jgi:hypothetical protein